MVIKQVYKQLYYKMMEITMSVEEVNRLHLVERIQKDYFTFNSI